MKTKSTNSVVLSGRLTADAKPMANEAGVRFSIAHNMGKDNDPVYADFTMFAKNGKVAKQIPTDLLVKGQAVLVSAYMTANNYTKEDGTEVKGIRYIVKSVESLEAEPAAEEDTAEEA